MCLPCPLPLNVSVSKSPILCPWGGSEDELEHAVPTFPKPTSVWLWTSELWHSHFAVSLCKWQFHLAVSLSSSFATWQFHLAVFVLHEICTKFPEHTSLWISNAEISLPFSCSGSAFVFPFLHLTTLRSNLPKVPFDHAASAPIPEVREAGVCLSRDPSFTCAKSSTAIDPSSSRRVLSAWTRCECIVSSYYCFLCNLQLFSAIAGRRHQHARGRFHGLRLPPICASERLPSGDRRGFERRLSYGALRSEFRAIPNHYAPRVSSLRRQPPADCNLCQRNR